MKDKVREKNKFEVEFQPVGRRGMFSKGESLLDCARSLGVDIVSLCGGNGSCGRCLVQVIEGNVSEPSIDESKFIKTEKQEMGYRLACRTIVQGDCKIRIPPESLTIPQRKQVEGESLDVVLEPPVKVYDLELAHPSLEDLRDDTERVLDSLAEQHGLKGLFVDFGVIRGICLYLRESDWQVRAVVRDKEVVALLPPGVRALGLAVDLGTTKVALYLMDMETGKTLSSRGVMNPQIAYGEDVISRMNYAWNDPANAVRIRELVSEAMNDAALEMCGEAGAKPEHIVESVVVANTAMHHLFLGLPVKQLAMSPYVPAVASELDVKARELGLKFAPGAYVHLLPNIAGYVGADHVSMLLGIDIMNKKGNVLAIDIGTNTEICFATNGSLTSLSCASGPAFEGAHVKFGMRAAEGAIERVRIVDGRVEFQTIGGKDPVGICGSGILDVLASLFTHKLVDRNGRMTDDNLLIKVEGEEREFILAAKKDNNALKEDITLNQKDVRELQLAKGAIKAGIDVLLATKDMKEEDIDQIIIAGAFGTYIDVKSGIDINMLPDLPLEKFKQVGNAAGMGAKVALVSLSKRAEAHSFGKLVKYVELAAHPNFSRIYANAMYLD